MPRSSPGSGRSRRGSRRSRRDLPAAEAARAEARAAAEMIAAEAADAATALFADRIAGLEARLPRVEAPRPDAGRHAELEAILALPGLVSLHRKAPIGRPVTAA